MRKNEKNIKSCPTTGCFISKSWESGKGPEVRPGNLKTVPGAHVSVEMMTRNAARKFSFDPYALRVSCLPLPALEQYNTNIHLHIEYTYI